MQKENANFCEYWHGNTDAFKPTHKTLGHEAKAKLDALFGNGGDNAAGDSEHGADAEETTQQVNAEPRLSAEEKAKAELRGLVWRTEQKTVTKRRNRKPKKTLIRTFKKDIRLKPI